MMKKKAFARGFRMGFDDKALEAVYEELGKVISGSNGGQEEEPGNKDEHARAIKR